MKKRIGNDISFTWRIRRKQGDELVPEDFDGKDCALELIDQYHRKAKVDDVAFATGVVTWTFKGKNQKATGTYTAVLSENRGKDEMVTVDVTHAVTLVPHTCMEDDGTGPDVVEAESVELQTTLSGAATQADWTETDVSSPAYIKHKPDFAKVATTGEYDDLVNAPEFRVESSNEELIIR